MRPTRPFRVDQELGDFIILARKQTSTFVLKLHILHCKLIWMDFFFLFFFTHFPISIICDIDDSLRCGWCRVRSSGDWSGQPTQPRGRGVSLGTNQSEDGNAARPHLPPAAASCAPGPPGSSESEFHCDGRIRGRAQRNGVAIRDWRPVKKEVSPSLGRSVFMFTEGFE